MTPQNMALVAAIAGHLLAISRLFNVLKPLYGWLPTKAQPIVIALVAGLPPLADALLGAATKEQIVMAVASGATAFFMALKGVPHDPPPGDARPVGPVATVDHIVFPNPRDPEEPSPPAAAFTRWRSLAWVALPVALTLTACGASGWEAQRTAANTVARVSSDTVEPVVLGAYKASLLVVGRAQTYKEDKRAAAALHDLRWKPVFQALDAFKSAHQAWQDQIDAKGDPLPAALAARKSFCELRALVTEWSVELPDFPGPISCAGAQ